MTRIAVRGARGALVAAGIVGLALVGAGAWLGAAVHPAFWSVPVLVAVNAALVGLAFIARRNSLADATGVDEPTVPLTILDRPKPSPGELWQQAEGDRDEYRRLLWEHGLLVARQPGDKSPLLPCGWPHRDATIRHPDGLPFGMAANPTGELPPQPWFDGPTIQLPQHANGDNN